MTHSRKLTDEQVREIRRSQESARALAERYGVSHPTILNVREGSTYSHVTDDEDDPIVGGIHNAYVLADALDFLRGLPDGYCRTVVTSPPEAVRPFSVHPLSARRHGARGTDARLPYRDYLEKQHAVIAECIRVAGDRGIVLYHHRPRFAMGHLDMGHYLTEEFPLRGVIIWHYKKLRFSAGTRNKRQLPNAYDMIFMFTGKHWALPKKSARRYSGGGMSGRLDLTVRVADSRPGSPTNWSTGASPWAKVECWTHMQATALPCWQRSARVETGWRVIQTPSSSRCSTSGAPYWNSTTFIFLS